MYFFKILLLYNFSFVQKKNSNNYKNLIKKVSDAYHLLLSKYFETIAQPKHKIDILYNKLLILYNLLYKWEEYMEIVKASTEVVNYYMSIEKKGANSSQKKKLLRKKRKKKKENN